MVHFKFQLRRSTCCHAAATLIAGLTFFVFAKTDVPVFLLSGQSNMTGYTALVSDLTADQKQNLADVMIYMDADGDGSKKKKWMALGPGFGASLNNFGPELFFGRTLSDSMPGKKIAFIKDAVGGTYLGKADGWLPPSSNNGTGGTLYKNMMTAIDAAMKSIGTAFDTSKYTPRWAGFMWFQGEFDAYDKTLSNAYEKNLTNLISDIRAKVNVADLPVILPMIDAQGQWTNYSIIRAADVKVKQNGKNIDTLDTKGFPTDGTHYRAAGQQKIGTIGAQRWVNMHFKYSPTVAIPYQYSHAPSLRRQTFIASQQASMLFDVSGRQIRALNSSISSMPMGVFIAVPRQGVVSHADLRLNIDK